MSFGRRHLCDMSLKGCNKLVFYGSFIFYKAFYEYIYIYIPGFIHLGLAKNVNFVNCILTNFMFFGMLLITPKNYNVPSTYLIQILLAFTFSPILSICWQADMPLEYAIYCSICYFLMAATLRFSPKISLNLRLANSYKIENILTGIIVTYIIVFIVTFGLADFRALDFSRIYEVRAERHFPIAWGYMTQWISTSILPCALVFCLYYKRYLLAMSLILIRFYMYLYTGSKTIVLSIAIILLFYYISRNKSFTHKLLLTMSSIFLLAVLANEAGRVELYAVVPTRFIYIPALISFRYFIFFSDHPKLLLTETIIGKIINLFTPYSSYLPETSSLWITHWFGYDNDNQVTGFLGDAYANGGPLLMYIYSLILALLLKLVDGISNKETIKTTVGCLGYTMIILNDGSLLTTLLTWGFALTIFILYLFHANKRLDNTRLHG